MNKQKLIKKYNDACFAVVPVDEVLEDLQQLDEPEKVKIPEFAADVIKEARGYRSELEDVLHYAWDNGTKEFTEWYRKKFNRDLFARAWLDGYEVEKEKRYTVVMKTTKQPLYYNVLDKKLFFSMGGLATKFTRKQLEESNFGWVFDCPGIEIEEVEE